jgi:cellulose synthase/poly-beta-1,6-N-acetylglucosamine synthase-like glycosyltransferase
MTVAILSPDPRAASATTLHVPPVPARPVPRPEGAGLARFLLEDGTLIPSPRLSVLTGESGSRRDMAGLLLAHGLVSPARLAEARARYHGLPFIDPLKDIPDIRLIDRLGAHRCLRDGLLPWRVMGGQTLILAASPDAPFRHMSEMAERFGPVRFALCPRPSLETCVTQARATELRRGAETRTAARDSCRTLPARIGLRSVLGAAVLLVMVRHFFPLGLLGAVTLLAFITMLSAIALKLAALLAALRHAQPSPARPAILARLPTVSIIVPLLREADIAPRLVRRLGRLDYPRDLLEVLLVVEENDRLTRRALADSRLPAWMRVICVPHGTLRTKPRALNYALDFCRGSLIGVYDAEDAPDPGQIRAVVEHFHQRDARVACLQGTLDFYNPRTNWIARCFTLEYATWFRVILPGLQRLGLPIPLGGTTLFFRRAALEALGGWDAHNVTEDADLGIRLYRRGYRTEVIATATREEANCHTLPWVRQRSRWIKGYMMTWRVHMRDPLQLWRDLGPRGFLGFQVLILGSLLHALLAPALLSFWLVFAGLPHPVGDALSQQAFLWLFGLFLLCEAINLTAGYVGLRRSCQPINPVWLVTLNLYRPLASLASYKALYEVLRKPFYWDKTTHGRHDRVSGA